MIKTRFCRFLVKVIIVILSASRGSELRADGGRPDLHYYISIYSYDDGVLNLPRNAHSFAGFLAWDQTSGQVVERFAISWLPSDGNVCAFGGIERGRNYSLPETFALGVSRGLDIVRFGPREVGPDFFIKARAQWERLEKASYDGSILYKAIDGDLRFRFEDPVINCMHAITGILGDLEFGRARGRMASGLIDRFFWSFYLTISPQQSVIEAFRNFEQGG